MSDKEQDLKSMTSALNLRNYQKKKISESKNKKEINFRVEMNGLENIKTLGKNDGTISLFLEKINKLSKLL